MWEYLDMGRHALYVWGSFGAAAVCMIAEPLLVRGRVRAIERRIARITRLNQETPA